MVDCQKEPSGSLFFKFIIRILMILNLMLRYDFLMLIRSISGKDGNVEQGKISGKGVRDGLGSDF